MLKSVVKTSRDVGPATLMNGCADTIVKPIGPHELLLESIKMTEWIEAGLPSKYIT